MELIPGRLYTPEEVSENQWLGKRSPDALRKAASPGKGQLQRTMSGGKIHFSYADILANQEAGLQQAKNRGPASASTLRRVPPPQRARRASAGETKPTVTALRPRPDAARRRRKAS
jgi:hypothetical protein